MADLESGRDIHLDVVFNALIFIVTAVLAVRFFRKDGKWSPDNGRAAFRFFTVQSNALCAVSALFMCVAPSAAWAWTLKYVGTAAVTVTMMTVFLFLAPSMGSLKKLLAGADFFMHLATPLLAIISFSFLEKRGMGFGTALLGMLPVLLYGSWYLYKVIYAPEDRRWNDFYGFNKGGKWPVSYAAMMIGGFLICMGLMALQNA